MTAEEFKTLKRLIPYDPREKKRVTTCNLCGGPITEDDDSEDLAYSKTSRGSHVFFHTRCLSPQGGKHAKR